MARGLGSPALPLEEHLTPCEMAAVFREIFACVKRFGVVLSQEHGGAGCFHVDQLSGRGPVVMLMVAAPAVCVNFPGNRVLAAAVSAGPKR